jgi:hypothetical protein
MELMADIVTSVHPAPPSDLKDGIWLNRQLSISQSPLFRDSRTIDCRKCGLLTKPGSRRFDDPEGETFGDSNYHCAKCATAERFAKLKQAAIDKLRQISCVHWRIWLIWMWMPVEGSWGQFSCSKCYDANLRAKCTAAAVQARATCANRCGKDSTTPDVQWRRLFGEFCCSPCYEARGGRMNAELWLKQAREFEQLCVGGCGKLTTDPNGTQWSPDSDGNPRCGLCTSRYYVQKVKNKQIVCVPAMSCAVIGLTITRIPMPRTPWTNLPPLL